jgi:hypothetical protein
VPHEPLLHTNGRANGIEPRAVRVPKRVRTEVTDVQVSATIRKETVEGEGNYCASA